MKTKPAKKRLVEPYNASVKVLGKTYKASGSSIKEALGALKIRNVKGVGVLTLSHGKAQKDRILNASQTFRLFSSSGIIREIQIKNLSSMFDL